jgi:hypothetical protein
MGADQVAVERLERLRGRSPVASQRLGRLREDEPEQRPRLDGKLGFAELSKSLSEVVRRHAILRTTFHFADGRPVQRIADFSPLPLPLIDLEPLSAEAREQAIDSLRRTQARRPFDLEAGPLLRACLVRVGPQRHVLIATLHHIVSDGWSSGIVEREVSIAYNAFVNGDEPTLAALTDGRLMMVMRGSNDKKPSLPGYKWVSFSSDGGFHWSTPKPWTYHNGEPFFSPSACSQLLRHSNGKLFWLGHITAANPRGNRPRIHRE